MSSHSNKKIKEHIDNSEELVKKMATLAKTLQEALEKNFEDSMNFPLPSAAQAEVRETDTNMFYSTEANVEEYAEGVKNILEAYFGGKKQKLIESAINIVKVLVTKITGAVEIQTGMHSTSVKAGGWMSHYIIAVFVAVQKANAKDWLTSTDFYVSYYAFVVFKPTKTQMSKLSKSPMLGAAIADLEVAPMDEIKEIATRNYTYTPL